MFLAIGSVIAIRSFPDECLRHTPSGAPELILFFFSGVRVAQSSVFCTVL